MQVNNETLDNLDQQTENSLRRLNELWQRSVALPTLQKQSLTEALEEHYITVQELQVASEELRCQNEELAAARQVVEAERQRYQELFEFAPDGYLVTDPNAVILEANQAAADLLSCSQKRLVGKPLVIFVTSEIRRTFHTKLSQLQSAGEAKEWVVQIQPRQGESFPAAFRVAAMQNSQGQVVGLRWLLQNITSRKQYEAALEIARSNLEKQVEERTAELSKTNEQLKQEIAFRQGAEAALRQLNTDLERKVQERTAQLQKSLDFEAMLKRITDHVRDSLDESKILQTVVQELTVGLSIDGCDTGLYDADHTTSTISYEYTVGMPTAQGHMVPMADFPEGYRQLLQGQYFQFCELVPSLRGPEAMLACPIFDDQGVLGDLWLFKQQDDAFNELEIRLVQQVANHCAIAIRQARLYQGELAQVEEQIKLNRLKDDFLSTVSHELRTPLANMKMALQMLALSLNRDKPLEAELAKPEAEQSRIARYFQILNNECERESSLINNLLDLQRLYAGVETLVWTSIQLHDWLPQIVKPFQERAQNRKLSLRIDISPLVPSFICESASLSRVVSELLENACKFTPPHEQIVVTAGAESGMMQLSVSNSGVEIPASELSRIFDKFYRIPNADPWKQGGTGLGLALVQQLVAYLGGTIRAESSAGQTRFTLQLPLRRVKQENTDAVMLP